MGNKNMLKQLLELRTLGYKHYRIWKCITEILSH